MQVCIEGGSSGPLAARALSAWLTHSKEAVLDLGITLEARTPAELPERLLGAVRLHHLDMQRCPTLLCGSDGGALTDALEPAVQQGLALWRQQQQQQQQQCCTGASTAGTAGSGSATACAAAAAAAVCTEASWGNASSEGVSMTADELEGMFLDNSTGHEFQLRGATYLEVSTLLYRYVYTAIAIICRLCQQVDASAVSTRFKLAYCRRGLHAAVLRCAFNTSCSS
jgi:Protein ENHANCED DISEASE RESISTANCE 2, C-terminal